MTTSQAVELIHTPLIEWTRPQSWCDLGCGSGTFTAALAQLLPAGSTIHAVDQDPRALAKIPNRYDGVEIQKALGDLQRPNLILPSVDGILMANILHFIREQRLFLGRLFSVTDRLLIVEYERSTPNPWGPYPVGFEKLCNLLRGVRVDRVERLTTRPSKYGGTIYSAIAVRSRA